MHVVIPAPPPQRRPLAVGPLRNTGSGSRQPPKHAWWKCLMPFDACPPSEKITGNKLGSRSQTPVEPSIHLEWARHCKSIRTSDASSGTPRNFGRPAALRPPKPSPKDEDRCMYPVGTGGPDWVQGLRDRSLVEPTASNWQEAKEIRRRKECGLRKLHLEQLTWLQKQKMRADSRLASIRHKLLEEDEEDEEGADTVDEALLTSISQDEACFPSPGHSRGVDDKGLPHIGSPRVNTSSSIRPSVSRSSSSASARSSESSQRKSVGELEHDVEITQDLLANNSPTLARAISKQTSDRPQSQAAIDHAHHEEGASLEDLGNDMEEEKPHHIGTHQRLSQRLSLKLGQHLRKCSLEPWEEWIAEFPIETLDSLADFYESNRLESDGSRSVGLAQLQSAMQTFLGFPPHSVADQVIANGLVHPAQRHRTFGDASEQGSANIAFSSLTMFLSLVRDVSHKLEKSQTTLVWSQEELLQLQSVFRANSNSHGRVQVVALFDIIQDIGMLSDVNLDDKEEQQWLSDVVGKIMSDRKPTEHCGTMSFDEFLRIVTSAMRDKERATRQSDFMLERAVRKECCFSALEMEDLRELHHRYAGLDMPRDKSPSAVQDPLIRMTLLLQGCRVPPLILHEDDKRILLRIIKETEEFDRIASGGLAPFDIFMRWMCEVFRQGIGDLQSSSFGNSGQATEEDLQGKKGFATVMLRERAREIKRVMRQKQLEEMSASSSPHTAPHSRRNSYRESRPGSRQHHELRQHRRTLTDGPRPFVRQLTTEYGRRPTNPRRHSGQPELKEDRKRSTSAAHRNKYAYSKSLPGSQVPSRRGSHHDPESDHGQHSHHSRDFKRANSRVSSTSSRRIEAGNTMRSTGLPPSDIMLQNRAFRATSMDMQGVESARNSPAASPRVHLRKQRTGLDSAVVIQETISRLESTPSPQSALKGSTTTSRQSTNAEGPFCITPNS